MQMAAAFQLAFSSFFPSHYFPISTKTAAIRSLLRLFISAARAPPPPSTSSNPPARKKHWKIGEYPGFAETSNNKKTNRIKNIKKKFDKKQKAKAWVNTVTEALSDAMDKKQWHRALEVFEMLKAQPFYYPKEGTYMKLLVLLGRCGQPGHAGQMFEEMINAGLGPTAELYTALMAAYCRNNLVDKAFTVLHRMKSLPQCQPDVYTYTILIKECMNAGHFDTVGQLYNEMADRSITPNIVTQNTVLSSYGKAGKYEEMEKVLSRMLESPVSTRPDVWTMNSVVGLLGNAGQIEMMEQWYEKFRDFGIEPESRTFNILIGAYGKKKMYDKMSSVMECMRKQNIPWTTSTYNNVIEAFSDVGDAEHMQRTFDQMRAEGIRADTKTLFCLIRGYANGGLFRMVIDSVQLAGKLEISENTLFFNAVIYACTKAGDLMEMERVFERMKGKGCRPDSTTYGMMMAAYEKEGMRDKVYDLEHDREMMICGDEVSKGYVYDEDDEVGEPDGVLLLT